MKKYIKKFKNMPEYKKKITDDDIINVIGCKGSGKTTLSNKYINDEYIVVNCDRLFSNEGATTATEDSEKIKRYLLKKYGIIKDGSEFEKYYFSIVDYIKSKKKKALIEGNVIQDIFPITKLKGTVIVKCTASYKCFIRAIKRDYKNKYFLDIEIKKYGKIIGRLTRLIKITKRRTKIFKQAKTINVIINDLDNSNNGGNNYGKRYVSKKKRKKREKNSK